MEFYQVEPSLENYWRSIILFGRNVASYKFALAKSLYELAKSPDDLIKLERLAIPFSRHLCEHLKQSPKQITSNSSKFIDSCVSYNQQNISQEALISYTVKLGFNNVIDAFHNVNNSEINKRFFIDERKHSKGIRLTDNFFKLTESAQFQSFNNETEARWRLVEEGWRLGVSKSLISLEYDIETKKLFSLSKARRVDITSCRDSLNGYQKGKCFYCYDEISVEASSKNLADVDHFLPWTLHSTIPNINGVWNLVLACKDCNRGESGKFTKVPSLEQLKRLYKRNEYLINSHLPLKETLILQTGRTSDVRHGFLQKQYNIATTSLHNVWEPIVKGDTNF